MCRSHYRRWQQAGGVRPTLDIAECAQLYRDGASSAGLGRLYGRTPQAILAALRAIGVQIRPPGRHTPRHNDDFAHAKNTTQRTKITIRRSTPVITSKDQE